MDVQPRGREEERGEFGLLVEMGQGGSHGLPRTRTRPDRLATNLRERIFARGSDLWRSLAPPRRSATRLCFKETLAPGTGPLPTPGTPTCSPRALPSSPAGQQALINKRPIRRWGAADEWTFRFQVWHRLGFPGAQGRAGRSCLLERGHGWGQRVLKTPTSR